MHSRSSPPIRSSAAPLAHPNRPRSSTGHLIVWTERESHFGSAKLQTRGLFLSAFALLTDRVRCFSAIESSSRRKRLSSLFGERDIVAFGGDEMARTLLLTRSRRRSPLSLLFSPNGKSDGIGLTRPPLRRLLRRRRCRRRKEPTQLCRAQTEKVILSTDRPPFPPSLLLHFFLVSRTLLSELG